MKLALSGKVKQLFSKKSASFLAGISLHSKFIRLVKGRVSNDAWHYDSHVEVAVDSEEQWVSSVEALIKAHKLTEAGCTLSLPFNRYQLLQIDKPPIPDEELAQALAWSIKDLVTIPQEELIADFFHVAAKIPLQGDKVNVVVTSRKVIMPLIDIFIKNKVELKGIVPEEMLIQNVVGNSDTASLLLSQQANEEVALQIVKKEQLYFARKLRGFNRIHEYTAQELIDGLIDSLSLEVQRSMDYFESQLKQAPIKNILLALPTEHQTLIAEQIAEHFPINVGVMGVTNQQVTIDELLSEQFYPALGGALEYLNKPESELEHEQ
ncbi:MAG: MSHA biogenesis protein MshI [Alteromonadaceae bacterium]|jgi:MSHA biogenesis protein MshI